VTASFNIFNIRDNPSGGPYVPCTQIVFQLSQDAGATYRNAAQISSYQLNTNSDGISFDSNQSGSLARVAVVSQFYNGVTPGTDNTYNLGHPSFRWAIVYAATGTINTSDAREKQQGRSLSDVEKAVAIKIKAGLKAFKWNEAVEEKGDKARWHFGVYAQDIAEAFKSEGLNPDHYGMFCYDEWDEQPEIKDDDGNVVQKHTPAGNRYGVRYDELLVFVISAL
jgi:hypothetical protein